MAENCCDFERTWAFNIHKIGVWKQISFTVHRIYGLDIFYEKVLHKTEALDCSKIRKVLILVS